MAEERVIEADGREELLGLLAAGDPKGEAKLARHAEEMVRSPTTTPTPTSRSRSRTSSPQSAARDAAAKQHVFRLHGSWPGARLA